MQFLTTSSLFNIVWESSWRHRLHHLPADALVAQNEATGFVHFLTDEGESFMIFDLVQGRIWQATIDGPDQTVMRKV